MFRAMVRVASSWDEGKFNKKYGCEDIFLKLILAHNELSARKIGNCIYPTRISRLFKT
jgi:hypothetical protein